ncbi:hypothetical protein [uncultured Erythrobacter sp.]|uniref:hypothetical protein n=1 Tax=uncultured Erythrobacter sp. TaxID=263913 RepID=UPI002630D23B|nr:hypothetical protein [uncultured Erythrobacter sp.]
MNYMAWVIGGFALLYFARAVEAFGDLGATPAERLPFYFAALAMLGGGLFCFFKGWRGAIAAIKDGLGKGRKPQTQEKKVPASRIVIPDTSDEFDADAALSRYMAKRTADPTVSGTDPASNKRSFGRKQS